MIARFAAATQPAVRPLPDVATQRLADPVARRRQIVEMIAAEKNRAQVPRIAKSIPRLIKAREKEPASVDSEIDAGIRGSSFARRPRICSLRYRGPVTARTLPAGLPELGRLDAKQIAALAGLEPSFEASASRRRLRMRVRVGSPGG